MATLQQPYVCLSLSFLLVLSSQPWTDTKQHVILCVMLLCLHCKMWSIFAIKISLYTAGAHEIWIDESGFSRREKLYCPDVNVSYYNQATFLSRDGIKYSWKGIYLCTVHHAYVAHTFVEQQWIENGFTIPKSISDCKKWSHYWALKD